jgi:nitric oxide reductase activation protein
MYRYKYDPNIFYDNSYKVLESDLAFGIVLDESGSMYGSGIENGRITMIVLHETLKALGINHSIIGHTSQGTHHSEIYRYQAFKEDKSYSTCKNYALIKTAAKQGNCDSGALYYMEAALSRVQNKDKVCLIFSDGAPTECTGTELVDQVKHMERNGIKVIGIGINFESISKYYTEYANGRNLVDMLNIVAKILEEYVLKKKDT